MPLIMRQPNAFAVMAVIEDLFRQTGRRAEWPEVKARMMEGDYAHLCKVADEVSFGTVQVITDDNEEEDE